MKIEINVVVLPDGALLFTDNSNALEVCEVLNKIHEAVRDLDSALDLE